VDEPLDRVLRRQLNQSVGGQIAPANGRSAKRFVEYGTDHAKRKTLQRDTAYSGRRFREEHADTEIQRTGANHVDDVTPFAIEETNGDRRIVRCETGND